MASGGKRAGAGRKTIGEAKRVTISVMVDQATKERITQLREQGWKLGQAIDEMVAKLK